MQACSLRVVLDLHLSVEVPDEPVQGGSLGSPHIRRGDHSERDAILAQHSELVLEQAQSVPLDERHDDVNTVGTCQLRTDLMTNSWLTWRIGEQRSIRQGRRWALSQRTTHGPGSGRRRDSEKLADG